MSVQEPSFTIGVEEEYLLVDRQTRDTVKDPPPDLMQACVDRLSSQVSPEFLRCQIEIGTRVAKDIHEAREDLMKLRACVSEECEKQGLAFIASSTHPFADWFAERTTPKERYQGLARDMGVAIRRLLICGMHVHVCIEDPHLRIDLMNQVRYLLPHLLALSTSSPFWQGKDTGLLSYRLAVFGDLPRSGMPEPFGSFDEYDANVQVLVNTGVIEDASKLWWDIRPSARFPTLEMRICDVCTRLEDGLTIAALYQAMLRMLYRLRRNNVSWRRYRNMLIEENRWRAQRYGIDNGLIDFGRSGIVPYKELLNEILDLIYEDADALGSLAEVQRARDIIDRGTSAHKQRALYQQATQDGESPREAGVRVVDWLIEESMNGISA